jgi:hypothetical protein
LPESDYRTETEGTAENLKRLIPPVLIALGAISLLRTSRFLSLLALGICSYDAAARSDAERKTRQIDRPSRREAARRLDDEIEASFPASDPPSSSGTTAGSP